MDSLAYRITGRAEIMPYPRVPLARARQVLEAPAIDVPPSAPGPLDAYGLAQLLRATARVIEGPVVSGQAEQLDAITDNADTDSYLAPQTRPNRRRRPMSSGQGRSIHIGLNQVDPDKYGGWSGDLMACESDADDMATIAESRGFASTTILTKEATSQRVLEVLAEAADRLGPGDTLLLTYSGHGGQIPDTNGEEPDGQDETWVLYDRQMLDDELHAAYSRFAANVRIAVFSDSCHSGSVTRAAVPLPDGVTGIAPPPPSIPSGARPRYMPPALCQGDFLRRNKQYKKIATRNGGIDTHDIAPCVLLISGCADNQVSLDGTHNGLFTATLLTVWNGGHFQGGYRSLHKRILSRMPESQSPKLSVVGKYDRTFVDGSAFTH
jgi:hypothetical protein